jgi:DMSO/TMAO reductase YedYZ molybdopterin-dependent catalytic subunit
MSDDLVQKRLRYIARQRELHREAVNVRFEGLKPEGSGPPNRDGLPKLPIGQHRVPNWPVLDLGDVPKVSPNDWRLDVGGHCENPFSLTWDEFLALPQAEDVSDFHCVTTWSRMDNHWRGVRFRTLAERCVPKDDARFVLCTGYDQAPGLDIPYTTNLPLARAIEDDVMLVHTWEGQPLPREHGGPCRMITPKLYAWKGTKWIRKIEFLPANKRGFWEERGYSDTAEPWFNDRYSATSVPLSDLRPSQPPAQFLGNLRELRN